jgi:sporulation protein YlmC with PRC-barrel domain
MSPQISRLGGAIFPGSIGGTYTGADLAIRKLLDVVAGIIGHDARPPRRHRHCVHTRQSPERRSARTGEMKGWTSTMKTLVRLAPAAALAVLLAGPAAAQQPPPPATTSPGLTVASDSLVGTEVRDAQGKVLGKISGLMIDARQGKIAAALIKQGGALGMGGKEISVPWDGLTLQRGQNQELVVTMQQQYLEQAPSASPGPDRQPERKQQ